MAFETFDLGRVIQTAEAIKGQRQQSVTEQLRQQYLGVQMQGAEQQQGLAAQAGKIQLAQEGRAAGAHQQEIDARTARQHYLTAAHVEASDDPVRAAQEFAPDLVQAFESQHGDGSFAALPPDVVKQMVGDAKARAAAAAGISLVATPEQQIEQKFRLEQMEQQGAQQREIATLQSTNQQELQRQGHGYDMAEIGARGAQDRATAEATTGRKVFKDSQSLRKEFDSLDPVKNFKAVQPILASASKAPDTGAGDLDVIYAVGKILDPGSVVREGELKLVIDAQSPVAKLVGATQFNLGKGGRITQRKRQELIQMLNGRVGAIRDAYDAEASRYRGYATDSGLDPNAIVGEQASPSQAAGGRVRVDASGNVIQ
jgi:hypothetical protein